MHRESRYIDTGARLSEVVNLRWPPDDDTKNDVDLAGGILRVLGKGRRERILDIPGLENGAGIGPLLAPMAHLA